MTLEAHAFDRGDLTVGDEPHRRFGRAAQIQLEVKQGEVIAPAVSNPYLNGKIQAAGSLWELAVRDRPLLASRQTAILRLRRDSLCTAVHILTLGNAQRIEPGGNPYERLYEWRFAVVGQVTDPIRLFPGPPPPPPPRPLPQFCYLFSDPWDAGPAEDLAVSDLLGLLGASNDDLIAAKSALRVNSEGGFSFRGQHGPA